MSSDQQEALDKILSSSLCLPLTPCSPGSALLALPLLASHMATDSASGPAMGVGLEMPASAPAEVTAVVLSVLWPLSSATAPCCQPFPHSFHCRSSHDV